MELYALTLKHWSCVIMSSHDVYDCQVSPQTMWRLQQTLWWDVTHLKITAFAAKAEKNKNS